MREELEQVLMSFYKNGMISFMKNTPEAFEEAIELALLDEQPLSWRAAWLLFDCMEENDPRIKKHLKKIIKAVKSKSGGHQREFLRILLKMDLTENQEGILFDICMNLWEDVNNIPSVRYTGFKFIVKIAKKHPELLNELSVITRDHYMQSLSSGIRHSVKRMMKEINLTE
jgi:hypothetical protein